MNIWLILVGIAQLGIAVAIFWFTRAWEKGSTPKGCLASVAALLLLTGFLSAFFGFIER